MSPLGYFQDVENTTRKISSALETKILKLYKANYSDFGPTLANEKLQQRQGLILSTEKLRKGNVIPDLGCIELLRIIRLL
jgi:hypothetical protein